jgi:3-mercaptopyruvate sulfurtransferase SseA
MKTLLSIVFILLTAIVAFTQTAPSKYKDDSEVPRISLKGAKQAFDNGTAVFVDARGRESYKENHIKGAINIPFSSTDNFDSLPKGKKIIVYCS